MIRLLPFAALLLLLLPLSARVTCKQLHSCTEACRYLAEGHKSLDRDRDGIPCEKLCHRPCDTREAARSKPKPRPGR